NWRAGLVSIPFASGKSFQLYAGANEGFLKRYGKFQSPSHRGSHFNTHMPGSDDFGSIRLFQSPSHRGIPSNHHPAISAHARFRERFQSPSHRGIPSNPTRSATSLTPSVSFNPLHIGEGVPICRKPLWFA